MVKISTALSHATVLLSSYESARLEAELLLAAVLNCSRTYLYTEPDQLLNAAQQLEFEGLVQARLAGQPIAYLLGTQEFWSLPLKVNAATLIPRPETELLVETVLAHFAKDAFVQIADLGTGSGAIALALAKECPDWQIIATDKSQLALEIAQQNAKTLQINNLQFCLGDWCHALPKQLFHALVSNPPYIAESDGHLQQAGLRFEPRSALVSAEEGLADIRTLIHQAKQYLLPQGWLWLEHGYSQGAKVRGLFDKFGYRKIQTFVDLAGLERVTGGMK